jgi:DNA-binding GntR family transcriptional regulator
MDTAASLTRVAYEQLRADLLQGHWPPGRKLLMHALRDRYGMGASPLREALNRLATEGLVVHNEQRGFCVADVSAAALADLVRTRIDVESLALRHCFDRRTPQWEESLLLAFHRLSRTPRSVHAEAYDENPEWERLHRAFHVTLLSNCGSTLLLGFCEQLYDQAYRYRQLAAGRAYPRRQERDEHQAMLEAVLNSDLQEALRLLASHYQKTASFVLEQGLAS